MTQALSAPERRVVAAAVLASFTTFLDGTVVNVALPAMSAELGGGLALQQWVVDAYLVTLSALILLAGAVSDAYGRVRVLRIGLAAFAATSALIALAPDPVTLVIARAAQGAAGALLVPASLALITAEISDAVRQSRAIGIWTACTTAAMIVGPVLGGLLVDLGSWRMVFLLNLPVVAAALLLAARMADAPRRVGGRRVDVLGGALCAGALGAAVLALIEQPRLGWPHPLVWGGLVSSVALGVAFILRQRRIAHPLVPVDLFRAGNMRAGNIATFFVYAALSLNGFVVAVYLQQGVGLSATLSGLASLPVTVLMILFSARAGAVAGRRGPRLLMTAGPLVMAAGALLLLTVADEFDYGWQMLPGMLLLGGGLAATVSPLTAAILGAVDPRRSGIASAVNNAVSRVAGLVSVALLSTIVGGELDLDGFHAAAIATAVLFAAGGIVSWAGIRDAPRAA
ncbi:MFS transporter [Microbacterium sp. NPDC055683]